MTIATKTIQWLFDEDLSVATVLGFLSIPFTLAVSLNTGPSEYDFGPVLLAGFLAGLYYSHRKTTAKRAGFRTGVIGGLATVWNAVSIVASGWAISLGYAALGVAFASLSLLFLLAVGGFLGVVGALAGAFVGRFPPFRRGASKPA